MGPVIHMLNKRQVHDRVHKSWPFHFALNKLNPVDIFTSCSYKIYFDIILPSMSLYNREARTFHSVNRLQMTMNADCLTESPCKYEYCMHKKKNYEALRYVIFFIPVFHLSTGPSTTGSTLTTNTLSVQPHATRFGYRRQCLATTTQLHVTVPRCHPHVRISHVLTVITDGQ